MAMAFTGKRLWWPLASLARQIISGANTHRSLSCPFFTWSQHMWRAEGCHDTKPTPSGEEVTQVLGQLITGPGRIKTCHDLGVAGGKVA